MERYSLIAIATSRYENLGDEDQRPQLIQVCERVVDLFVSKLGRYRRKLVSLSDSPTADQMRRELDEWFALPEHDESEWIVFYYTGHAEVAGSGSLFLLTTDFKPPSYVGTAFEAKQLADIVLAAGLSGTRRGIENVLFIIDTCFAGEAGRELAVELGSAFLSLSRGIFYLIGASLPLEEANAGAFAEAFISAIEELSNRHVMQEYFYLDQIIPGVNERLGGHRAVSFTASSPQSIPKFFPNPNFIDTANSAILASDAQRAIVDRDFREHWGPRSRGVEFDRQTGSYFSGRTKVLRRLFAFLSDAKDSGPLVVTGKPGAGKSAILGRVVALAKAKEFPEVDLAIFLRNKTVDDVVQQLAIHFGVEATLDPVLKVAADSSEPIRIVADALDESAEPVKIIENLLRPLGAMPPVHLILGTRAQYASEVGASEIIDIDSREYADRSDIAAYVAARLRRQDEPYEETFYTYEQAAAVGLLVAKRVHPNFLTARLIAEYLLAKLEVVDIASLDESTFPQAIGNAFDLYLSRFGENEQRVRDILLPLAFAQGLGLPWDNIWPSVASKLSDRRCANDDVRWVLQSAGAFILESRASERSVYRLYHEALAEDLHADHDAQRIHHAFVDALIASVPRREDVNAPDWRLANPYVRSYLIVHAARSGMVAEVVNPLFLLTCEPRRLLSLLQERPDALPPDLGKVYRDAAHQIGTRPLPEAASYLELSARERQMADLAETIAKLPLLRPWRPRWAKWGVRTASPVLFRGNATITTFKVAAWLGGSQVVLIGRSDGSVELWSISELNAIFQWRHTEAAAVSCGDVAVTSHGAWLVVALEDGTLAAFNMAESLNPLISRCPHDFSRLKILERGAESVCVAAADDHTLIMYRLADLDTILERSDATRTRVYAMAAAGSEQEPILVTGGDSLDDRHEDCSKMWWWSLRDLSPIWDDEARGNPYSQFQSVKVFGRSLILALQGWGPAEIWEADERRICFRGGDRFAWSLVYDSGDDVFLISAGADQTSVDRLCVRTEEPFALRDEHVGNAEEIGGGTRVAGPVLVGARSVVLVSQGNSMRSWDCEELVSHAKTTGEATKRPWAADSVVVGSGSIYFGLPGRIAAVAPQTAERLWETILQTENRTRIRAVALSPDEKTLFVCAFDGMIYLIDANEGNVLRSIATQGQIWGLSIARSRDRLFLFTTSKIDEEWVVRIWEAETGREVPTHKRLGLSHGQGDKVLTGLTALEVNGNVRFAFASKYGKVMVATFDAVEGISEHRYGAYETWDELYFGNVYINRLTNTWMGTIPLLAAGTDEGGIGLWDFLSGKPLMYYPKAHAGAINALSFKEMSDKMLLLSAGDDGCLRIWALKLGSMALKLIDIDIGESISDATFYGDKTVVVATAFGVLAIDLDWEVAEAQGMAIAR